MFRAVDFGLARFNNETLKPEDGCKCSYQTQCSPFAVYIEVFGIRYSLLHSLVRLETKCVFAASTAEFSQDTFLLLFLFWTVNTDQWEKDLSMSLYHNTFTATLRYEYFFRTSWKQNLSVSAFHFWIVGSATSEKSIHTQLSPLLIQVYTRRNLISFSKSSDSRSSKFNALKLSWPTMRYNFLATN